MGQERWDWGLAKAPRLRQGAAGIATGTAHAAAQANAVGDKLHKLFKAVDGEVGPGVGIAVEDDGGHAQGRGAGKFHGVMADERHALGRQVHGIEGGLVGFPFGHGPPQVDRGDHGPKAISHGKAVEPLPQGVAGLLGVAEHGQGDVGLVKLAERGADTGQGPGNALEVAAVGLEGRLQLLDLPRQQPQGSEITLQGLAKTPPAAMDLGQIPAVAKERNLAAGHAMPRQQPQQPPPPRRVIVEDVAGVKQQTIDPARPAGVWSRVSLEPAEHHAHRVVNPFILLRVSLRAGKGCREGWKSSTGDGGRSRREFRPRGSPTAFVLRDATCDVVPSYVLPSRPKRA